MNQLFNIAGRVIVITGGTGVLGRSIATYLAREGATVVILARNEQAGNALVNQIVQEGGRALFFPTNVTCRETLEANKVAIMQSCGRIDALLNAAGGNMPGATIPPDKTILDLQLDAFREVVDLNLFGTVLPIMVFADVMAQQGEAAIVNFSSMTAFRPCTRVAGYSAAKAAINNFTRFLAAELAMKFGNGLRVNAIAPGFFLTEQNRALLTNPDGSYTERARNILAHTPFGRFGQPDELCGTIHYLISDASRFVTGSVAVVDGGFNAFCI